MIHNAIFQLIVISLLTAISAVLSYIAFVVTRKKREYFSLMKELHQAHQRERQAMIEQYAAQEEEIKYVYKDLLEQSSQYGKDK